LTPIATGDFGLGASAAERLPELVVLAVAQKVAEVSLWIRDRGRARWTAAAG
jgi:hypothetical protein